MDDPHAHRRPPNDGRLSYVWLTFLALDNSYGWIGSVSIFSSPSVAPLSKGCSEYCSIYCWLLTRVITLVVKCHATCRHYSSRILLFQIVPRVIISLVDLSRWFKFSRKMPRVIFWLVHIALLTSPLGPINMCILSLTLHFSHNFSSSISSKSLV